MQERGEVSPERSRNIGDGERAASAVIGAGLIATAAFVRSPLAIVGGVLGAALVARGVTGTCLAYRALGRSSAPSAAKDHGLHVVPTREEARIDDMLDDSFPASDPPAW